MKNINTKIETLKSMQKYPKFYIANFFSDLKKEIDLVFALKLTEKLKYIELINRIESLENDLYKKSKPFNTFNKEIQFIEQQINDYNLDINEKNKSLDEIKYQIEKKLFSNKSILFMKNYKYWNYNQWEEKTFLIIINDEYLRNSVFLSDQLQYFDREKLIAHFLREKLCETDLTDTIFLCLNIEIISKTSIKIFSKRVQYIDQNAFKGLKNLNSINFSNNQLKEIHPSTFNGLINLEVINFWNNEITRLHSSTFNGLINLKEIYFDNNQIKEIPFNTFNETINLMNIYFRHNQIKELHSSLFNGLTSLKEINFNSNQIKKIPSLSGLISLKRINFCKNKLKEIQENAFNGLNSLEFIDLADNQIDLFDLNIFLFRIQFYFLKINFKIY